MKKLVYSSLVLILFSLSIILFQMSCQKEIIADSTTNEYNGKILYFLSSDGGNKPSGFWTSNLDGTNQIQIPINVPEGLSLYSSSGRITPDGKTLIFELRDQDKHTHIYSVSVDGSNLKKLIDGSDNNQYCRFVLQQIY